LKHNNSDEDISAKNKSKVKVKLEHDDKLDNLNISNKSDKTYDKNDNIVNKNIDNIESINNNKIIAFKSDVSNILKENKGNIKHNIRNIDYS
jgi:hypothetical protein